MTVPNVAWLGYWKDSDVPEVGQKTIGGPFASMRLNRALTIVSRPCPIIVQGVRTA